MMITDKAVTAGREVVKAKWVHGGKYVMSAFGDSLALFDIRKPAIILSQSFQYYESPARNNNEEINDFDVTYHLAGKAVESEAWEEGNTFVATCDDSGLAHVYSLDKTNQDLTLC
jgi:hypothetical protein